MNLSTPVKVHFYELVCRAPRAEHLFMANADDRRAAFRAVIKRTGLSAGGWARKAGVAKSTLSQYLSGKTQSLNQLTLEKLAKAAQVPVAELTGSPTSRVDDGGNAGIVSRLSDEDVMNLQLMVQLLRQIAEQQAQTTKAIVDLTAAVKASLSNPGRLSG